MTEMVLAHGGTTGLMFELAFVVIPLMAFIVMAVLSRRRARKPKTTDQEVEP